MQNAPVAVAQASQHKYVCHYCTEQLEDFCSQSVCPRCGNPQPLQSWVDYFEILGIPRKFQQDSKKLEKNFYALSRLLHPDRFSTAGLEVKNISLQRMSWVNQAYTTLKNSQRLREYLLHLEGLKISQAGKSKIPVELAEAWFDLQDQMSEGLKSQDGIFNFKVLLSQHRNELEKKILELEKKYDLELSRDLLEKLADEIQVQNYLNSIEKDMERIIKNANSN